MPQSSDVYSFRSLPRFLLTNISRLPTLLGENRGGWNTGEYMGAREVREAGEKKGERQKKIEGNYSAMLNTWQ